MTNCQKNLQNTRKQNWSISDTPVKQKPRREIVRKVGGYELRRHTMGSHFLGMVLSNNGSQPRASLLPREVAMSRDIFGYLGLEGWVLLLASTEPRLVVLLNILQFTGSPFTTKNYPT